MLRFIIGFLFTFGFLLDAQALRLSIRQTGDGDARVVAVGSDEVASSSQKRSALRLGSRTVKLATVKDRGPQPVVFGYKKGSRLLSARRVLANPSKYCNDGNIEAFTSVTGRNLSLRLATRSQGDVTFYRGSLRNSRSKKRNQRRIGRRNAGGLVSVSTSTCVPSGNGLTLGINSSGSESLALRSSQIQATDELDSDQDGLADIFDADLDGDGIINNFDPGFSVADSSFYLFSNLKVVIENALNVNTGVTPTDEQIDSLVNGTTLAIQVRGEESASEVSELDCGTLGYCSAGGTGQNVNDFSSPTAFPGAAGGANDADSDGLGEITRGNTGDFQLATNADAADINGGDTIIQLVTDSNGNEEQHVASLQFVFNTTPAMKTVVVNPNSGTPTTVNYTYPVASGTAGTQGNCLNVAPNGDGNVILDITAWRPQRKGLAALGEADFVDIGNARVSIDIPNAPSVSGSGGSGPGMCPISSYTTTDTNLTADGDSLQDSLGDQDADPANTVNFQVNITDCLDSAGQTLDAGEQLRVGLQFRNSVGDNAAQAICIERP